MANLAIMISVPSLLAADKKKAIHDLMTTEPAVGAYEEYKINYDTIPVQCIG
jgi:hypothetical protein